MASMEGSKRVYFSITEGFGRRTSRVKTKKPASRRAGRKHEGMVPKAGLEPARISPHAPQTCASTNSATWAAGGQELLARRGCRRAASCLAGHDRCAWSRLKDGERKGRDDEEDEE